MSCSGPDPAALPEKLRPAYVDLKNAQIKTLSFLTYLMRSPYNSLVRPHQVRSGCSVAGFALAVRIMIGQATPASFSWIF